MFNFARYVVRHKVGAVAVLALAVVFATPDKDDEVQASSSPWSAQAQPVQVAQVDETGFMDDMLTEASGLLDETGMNPLTQVEENGERLEGAASALTSASN